MKILVDNNMSPKVAKALQDLFEGEHTIIHLREKFPANITDLDWMSALGKEGGWTVLSNDRMITRNKAERTAFKNSKILGFFLNKKLNKSRPKYQVYRLLHLWDNIEKVSNSIAGGGTFEVTETKIKQL